MADPIRLQMTDEEWEAIQAVWNREGQAGTPIPEVEAVRMLVEIRVARETPPDNAEDSDRQ